MHFGGGEAGLSYAAFGGLADGSRFCVPAVDISFFLFLQIFGAEDTGIGYSHLCIIGPFIFLFDFLDLFMFVPLAVFSIILS